jgi:hypothetical protein
VGSRKAEENILSCFQIRARLPSPSAIRFGFYGLLPIAFGRQAFPTRFFVESNLLPYITSPITFVPPFPSFLPTSPSNGRYVNRQVAVTCSSHRRDWSDSCDPTALPAPFSCSLSAPPPPAAHSAAYPRQRWTPRVVVSHPSLLSPLFHPALTFPFLLPSILSLPSARDERQPVLLIPPWPWNALPPRPLVYVFPFLAKRPS